MIEIDSLPHVPPTESGYSPADVRSFAQTGSPKTFRAVKGGLDPAVVDAALDTAEDESVLDAAREHRAEVGEEVFAAEFEADLLVAVTRALRVDGAKFREPHTRWGFLRAPKGYRAAEVDEFCRAFVAFAEDPRYSDLNPAAIRRIRFGRARFGQDPVYDEAQVDAFLDDVTRLSVIIVHGTQAWLEERQ